MPQRNNARPIDLDVSAVLIAERLIGEILGWDMVDWPATLPHKGRKFFFGRQRQSDPSIHGQLRPLYDRCDAAMGDFNALKPSPIVNDALSRLVGCLCRHVGKHALPAPEMDISALHRTIEQENLHHAVIARLLGRIDGTPNLSERAARLKTIASAAENQLERHFADLINQRLESDFLPGGALDRQKARSLRDQAKRLVEETCLLNERELVGLTTPALALDDEALVRIEMARILLGRFPYVRNYELMLLAELAMLQRPPMPRFVRERMLASEISRVDRTLIERLDMATARLSSLVETDTRQAWQGALADRTIAICGSGSLPMSALFLHLFTGATLILIDADRGAVERSTRLLGNLERLEILKPGALTVHLENAKNVAFHAPGRSNQASNVASIDCDAIMLASLVDSGAKTGVADQVRFDPDAPDLLIMRSATGLSAMLAYDAVPTEALSHGGLVYCGETLPATQVATHLDRGEAIRQGVACVASPDVLAIAHPDVVNTTEVYRRISAPDRGLDRHLGAGLGIDDWVQTLERLGDGLGSGEPGRS